MRSHGLRIVTLPLAATRHLASSLLGLVLLAPALTAATVTVNDAGDSTNACAASGTGTCTLRDALTYANANAGSTIAFDIAGAGVHTIAPATPYPSISAKVTIDGFTQPGSSPNSNGPGLGDNSVHLIEIDGTHAGAGILTATLAFAVGSNDSVIRGLVVNRSGAAIQVAYTTTSGHVIEGNFLGTDPTGTVAVANGLDILIDVAATNVTVGGITPASRNLISGASAGIGIGSTAGNGGSGHLIQGNFIGTNAAGTGALGNGVGISMQSNVIGSTIGGNTPAARNVISGNQIGVGVSAGLGDPTVTGNFVIGNYIGVDVSGSAPLGNSSLGIGLNGIANTIGGAGPGEGNVISGNQGSGIQIIGGNGSIIQGNLIGTDAAGVQAFGNSGYGIYVGASSVVVGGIAPGQGNVIAFNGATGSRPGLAVVNGTNDVIRGNSIHDNAGIGIDLADDGTTPNDAGDADTGANNRQNFPLIKTIVHGAGTQVTGVLHSTAGAAFDLDFYASASCSTFPREFLEGETYLGTSPVSTDGAGNATFDVMLPATDAGARISATATDPSGNTSEFSQRLPFSVNIGSGDAAGGATITVSGTDFEDGAVVQIGGASATGVVVGSSTSLTAVTPPLVAGSANDLVVTNPDLTTGTLVKGWVADFLDVPGRAAVPPVRHDARLQRHHRGRRPEPLRRQRRHAAPADGGLPAQGQVRPLLHAPALHRGGLHRRALLLGLCPVDQRARGRGHHRRLRRRKLLPDEPGPAPADGGPAPAHVRGSRLRTPGLRDSDLHRCALLLELRAWIYELVARNITAGCGGGNYCPTLTANRGQMATFVVKTFSLQ